ncbi:facilitated trehalose transporter Tret1-like [Lutzomyia longipalpis]|uniref:facilitated trehalose transporter Tret1-like n=1 Tax=Lutzomyia longipalpis TaxID=7200 RepID=UPI00248401C4|nr:facilitated trehalose transporter Tret1-like [Lutzomyia longipalpis]XP_055686798.1 facilitated trehalose transporter Tret1-like [Lutzomyia longipalpis]XP_055686807.1 facilitated trehalose transporter Tret1-like [Lutzomyia longipalpis]XP_055686816.1 facilitated trehalose transporter Tret1-like [Lutzomyia longipalpis]XP_055686824.1 facilitated trehalose transporter Tret1-like [Lutzomyia longipalpis]XP_055686835.1 facilitated trehalose transporter Tret1-like [Lutzomyia longipalpis]XP_05568684
MGKSSYNVSEFKKGEKSAGSVEEVSKFRRYLPQILASTAKNFLLLDLGLSVAFPTIVIPALRGTLENLDPTENLAITEVEASWLGSIAFICQPVGSVLSGWVTEPLGRKLSMILVNIPHIIAWIMLYYANSLPELYTAAVLLGLGVGFMEAPIITYVGEISEPSIRGILTSCAGVSVMMGIFIVYFLGTVVTWRVAALICLAVPLSTLIAICFVPETPLWLLSKGKVEEAEKSLQWLRGWVSPAAVQDEFKDLQQYSVNSNKCAPCQKKGVTCTHPPETLLQRGKELFRHRTLKPFALVMALFFFLNFTGSASMRPFMVQIFQAYGTPIDGSRGIVIMGLVGIIANIIMLILVRKLGKRGVYLISMAGTTIACLGLAFYASTVLPSDWSSFDKHLDSEFAGTGTFPMIMFFLMSFFSSFGISAIPWMLLSEVFPFKSRGMATGITAALNYIMAFLTTKTYLNVEHSLGLDGAAWLYGCIGVVGFAFTWFCLPETEKRTLEEIEMHFSAKGQKFTKTNIQKKLPEAPVEVKIEGKIANSMTASVENMGCDNRGFER